MGASKEGMLVHPTPFEEQSVLDSARDLLVQAVNQSEGRPETEEVCWVRFCQCDLNDVVRNPIYKSDASTGAGLVLILGYTHGIAVWHLMANTEARELYSSRSVGTCRTAMILPTPAEHRKINRPYLALVVGSEVKIVSLANSKEIHSIKADGEVEKVDASEKYIAISSPSTISLYSADKIECLYTIKDCLVPGRDCNPFALGKRWLAYSPEKLDIGQQSLGGYFSTGSQSYTATMLSAAKTLGKGLSLLGETVGRMAGSQPRNYRNARDDEQKLKNHRGIVSVVDLELLADNRDQPIHNSIVSHWVAHPKPVAAASFSPHGNILVTADVAGRQFHVFSIHVHPQSSADSAVHHLYTLHRGETTAQVFEFSFSNDCRWISAVTRRGTAHIFPINAYGGEPTVRTHCVTRVSNQKSLFHISAGINYSDPKSKDKNGQKPNPSVPPIKSSSPKQPPFPTPTVILPVVQIKQGLVSGLIPAASNYDAEESSEQISTIFAFNKTCVSFSREILQHSSRGPHPEGLYVINGQGILSEFTLQVEGVKINGRLNDQSSIEVVAKPSRQWNLQRQRSWNESSCPLPQNSPLILASDVIGTSSGHLLRAELETKRSRTTSMSTKRARDETHRSDRFDSLPRSRQSSTDSDSETKNEWLGQIEMNTHDSPARRLWMGPQFRFVQNTTGNHESPFERRHSPESALLNSQEDIQIHLEQSKPKAMPNRIPAHLSDQFTVPGNSCPTIEIGSGHFDAFQGPGSGEDRVKQTLAEAMLDEEKESTRRISDSKWPSPYSDDETDLIMAVGEFELSTSSPPSSVHSLQMNTT